MTWERLHLGFHNRMIQCFKSSFYMFIRSSAKEKKTMAKYWNKIHQLTPPGFFFFFTRNFFKVSVQISSSTMWYKLSGWQKCERCDTNSWKIPASLMDLCPCGRSQQVATSHFGSSLSRLTYSVSGAHPLHIHTRRRKNKHTFQQFPWQDFNCQREIFSDTDLRFSS